MYKITVTELSEYSEGKAYPDRTEIYSQVVAWVNIDDIICAVNGIKREEVKK